MLFTTINFGLFFAIMFLVYWAMPGHRARMFSLLVGSAIFYWLSSGWGVSLLFASCLVGYILGMLIDSCSGRTRKYWLILGIVLNLCLLGVFKYFNFFIESATLLLAQFGWQRDAYLLHLALPLGISFFTFEAISYLMDVYRGKWKAVRDPLEYALFIFFFPHLVAGPIIRAGEFIPQMRQLKKFNWNRMLLGTKLILLGLLKKGVLADHLATVAEPIFAHPDQYATGTLWVGMFAYSLQLYLDFSGYADLALGCAHMFGFKLPVNFKNPLMAVSIIDFWRRWHCTLSRWLYDYLYLPLGGNKHGPFVAYRNVLLVFLASGLWHGANWTFLLWGLYHGILICLQRIIPWPRWMSQRLMTPVCIACTFLLVSFSRVLSRSPTVTDMFHFISGLFRPLATLQVKPGYFLLTFIVLILTVTVSSLYEHRELKNWLARKRGIAFGFGMSVFWIALLFFWPEKAQTFIYFQF